MNIFQLNTIISSALSLGLGISLLILSSALDVKAECVCPPKQEVGAALESASVCFVGQVEKIQENPLKPGYREIRFSVLKSVKAMEELPGRTILILTPTTADTCGFEFVNGQDYLVYATGSPATLHTDSCSRTQFYDNAVLELDQLKKLTAPKEAAPAPIGEGLK